MVPENEWAAPAAGRGHLRASHADRQRVLDTLKAAFVQGRLAKDEFDLRMNRTFGSRTYAELAALTADLPVVPVMPGPPPAPVPAEDPARIPTALGAGAWTFVWLGLASIPGSFALQSFLLMVFGVLCLLVASPLAGGWVVQTWRERHAGGQPPASAAPG